MLAETFWSNMMCALAKPKSASNKATRLLSNESFTAQLTASEVFPTPPLPLAIAIVSTMTYEISSLIFLSKYASI